MANGYGAVFIVVTVFKMLTISLWARVRASETCTSLLQGWRGLLAKLMFGELEWVLPTHARYVLFQSYKCGG